MREAEHHLSVIVFIALVAIAGMMLNASSQPTGAVTHVVPQVKRQTVIITGIDLNDNLGQDIDVLTSQHLSSLASGIIYTQEGSTKYNQILRLQKANAFNGGDLVYGKAETDEVSDFVMWSSGTPLFEYELEFNPGLEGRVVDGRSDDIEGKSVLLLGRPAYITRVEASGTQVTIRFFTGAGEVEFSDSDVTDDTFEDGVEVGGDNVDGQVKIRGTVAPSRVKIFSIQYRPETRAIRGGDVYVPQAHGLRGKLMYPGAMLNPSFDIIYGGLSQGRSSITSQPTRPRVSGQLVHLYGSGDEYKLQFTNVRGQTYTIPAWKLDGSISLGKDDDDLIVVEGSSNSDYNVNEGDYFLLSSGSGTNEDTNVLRLQSVSSNEIFVDDLAGGRFQKPFDATTGEGTLVVSGRNYRFFADPTTDSIAIDQTGDGSISGERAQITLNGGVQLRLFSSSMQVRVPTKLFKDDRPSSDEVTTVNIVEDSGDIDATVSGLKLQSGRSRIESGMTNFGILFELDDDSTPADLKLTVPGGQVGGRAFVRDYPLDSGQSRGWIVITTERERFLRE